MLFGDATQIVMGWDGLAAAGGLIGSGIAAAAKILVSYLTARDATVDKRIDTQNAASNKLAEDGQKLARELQSEDVDRMTSLLAIQKEALGAIGDMRMAIQALTDRMNRSEAAGSKEYAALRDQPPPRQQRPRSGPPVGGAS